MVWSSVDSIVEGVCCCCCWCWGIMEPDWNSISMLLVERVLVGSVVVMRRKRSEGRRMVCSDIFFVREGFGGLFWGSGFLFNMEGVEMDRIEDVVVSVGYFKVVSTAG